MQQGQSTNLMALFLSIHQSGFLFLKAHCSNETVDYQHAKLYSLTKDLPPQRTVHF